MLLRVVREKSLSLLRNQVSRNAFRNGRETVARYAERVMYVKARDLARKITRMSEAPALPRGVLYYRSIYGAEGFPCPVGKGAVTIARGRDGRRSRH